MAQVSAKLRSIGDAEGRTGFVHWCPGCEEGHVIWTTALSGPKWDHDGNVEVPTFNPSIRLSDDVGTKCHYFIHSGEIKYCGDCRHALSGQSVPLPDLPQHWRDEE